MSTNDTTIKPPSLAEAVAAFSSAIAEAVEKAKTEQIYGFALFSLVDGHDDCECVETVLRKLSPKRLAQLIEACRALPNIAAQVMNREPGTDAGAAPSAEETAVPLDRACA